MDEKETSPDNGRRTGAPAKFPANQRLQMSLGAERSVVLDQPRRVQDPDFRNWKQERTFFRGRMESWRGPPASAGHRAPKVPTARIVTTTNSRSGWPVPVSSGATVELGFHAVKDLRYVTEIHATLFHVLSLAPARLDIADRKRLEIDFGEVIRDILA